MSYGKRCVMCQIYFVTDSPDDRLCLWCSRILNGHGRSTHLLSEEFQS